MMRVLRQLPRNSSTISAVRAAAIMRFGDDAADGGAHEHRLVAGGGDGCTLGYQLADPGQTVLDGIDDGERRGRTGLLNGHQHGTTAIDAHDVGLRRMSVMHEGHIAQVGDRTVAAADRQIVQGIDGGGLPFRRTLYSVLPIFCVPAGMMSAWFAMVVLTSMGVRPWARKASGRRSICTWRVAPPKG